MTTEATPEPTLDEILHWDTETKGELPEQYQHLGVERVREHVAASAEAAASAERTEAARRQAEETERQRAENARVAQVAEDIRFAEEIDAHLLSDDEAERRAAALDKQNNADRYAAGVTGKANQSYSVTMNRVLREHYGALTQQMAQGNQYSEFVASISDRTVKAGNNPLVAAIEYGKTITATAEYERGKVEGARAERIALGREAAPDPGPSSPSPVRGKIVLYHQLTPEQRAAMSPQERDAAITAGYAAV